MKNDVQRSGRFRRGMIATLVILAAAAASVIWALLGPETSSPTLPEEELSPIRGGAPVCEAPDHDVSVYLRAEVTHDELQVLKERITGLRRVEAVSFFSVAEVYHELKELYGDAPKVRESLHAGKIPASLRVFLMQEATADDGTQLVRQIRSYAGVSQVRKNGKRYRCEMT